MYIMGDNVCKQRQRQMLFHIPSIRLTPISPYESGFTQHQLDMRRKVEILQYSASKSNTKTNDLTRKEKWSQIANGNYRGNVLYKKATIDCSGDDAIPTLTSGCDVPGPIISLYYDKNVPLYNYATRNDAYAVEPPKEILGWTFTYNNDTICSSYIDTNIASICIRDNVIQDMYTFTLNTPIAIFITGQNTNSLQAVQTMNLAISSITPSIWYNGNEVNVPGMVCKLNGNVITGTNNVQLDLSLSAATTNAYPFNAVAYAGIVSVSNIALYTSPGFVYDIHLKIDVDPKTNPNNIFQSGSENTINGYGVYCNLTSSNNNTPINCTITNTIATNTFSPFSLTGN